MGLPGGSDSKEPARSAGDLGLIPGLGRSSGERNGSPLQYSHLENSMDRGAWWATVHGIAKSRTPLKELSTHAHKSLATAVADLQHSLKGGKGGDQERGTVLCEKLAEQAFREIVRYF